jgi:hypothetical protein
VFDIDETLTADCIWSRKEEVDADIHLKFSSGLTSKKDQTQNRDLLPGILELLQYVVRDRNLRIAFFSSAPAVRNEALIPIILEKAFPTTHEEMVKNCPVFSRHHIKSNQKKDLNIVVEYYENVFKEKISLENVILIDDDSSAPVEGQNYIRVPWEMKRDCIFYVAGFIADLLTSDLSPSGFLNSDFAKTNSNRIPREIAFPLQEKGLAILQQITPELKLVDRHRSHSLSISNL